MSHILFGDFFSNKFTPEQIKSVKLYSEKKGIYYWFNKEINFYNDIHTMFEENKKPKNDIKFCITSCLQPTNSEDLLFPYNKYDENQLFPKRDSRSAFEDLCKLNLSSFYDTFRFFEKTLSPKGLRVIITEGYDCDFRVEKCTSKIMLQDIERQIITSHMLDSVIYELAECECT